MKEEYDMFMAVRVHNGHRYVEGMALRYPYYVASLFEVVTGRNGRKRWVNTGAHTAPRRSRRLAERDGYAMAEEYGAAFVEGYGSLHNMPFGENGLATAEGLGYVGA